MLTIATISKSMPSEIFRTQKKEKTGFLFRKQRGGGVGNGCPRDHKPLMVSRKCYTYLGKNRAKHSTKRVIYQYNAEDIPPQSLKGQQWPKFG